MAGTYLNVSADKATALSKVLYLNYIKPQVNTGRYTWNMLSATRDYPASLNSTKYTMKTNLPFGVGAVADGGSFPASSAPSFSQATIPFVEIGGTVGITGRVLAVNQGESAIADGTSLPNLMKDGIDGYLKTLEFLLLGHGNRRGCHGGSSFQRVDDHHFFDARLRTLSPQGRSLRHLRFRLEHQAEFC